MGYDVMLMAHEHRRWAKAEYLALPFEEDEPVVWVDPPTNDLCIWHPALAKDGRNRVPGMAWTQAIFQKVAGQIRNASRPAIRERINETGVPGGYYSDYPLIVRKMVNGDFSFTQPADASTDKMTDLTGAETDNPDEFLTQILMGMAETED